MFSLLLLTPKHAPFCLHTLRLAHLCLDRRSVSPLRERAGIAAGAQGAGRADGTGVAAGGTPGTASSAGVERQREGSALTDPRQGLGLYEEGGFGDSRSRGCCLHNVSPPRPLQHTF